MMRVRLVHVFAFYELRHYQHGRSMFGLFHNQYVELAVVGFAYGRKANTAAYLRAVAYTDHYAVEFMRFYARRHFYGIWLKLQKATEQRRDVGKFVFALFRFKQELSQDTRAVSAHGITGG